MPPIFMRVAGLGMLALLAGCATMPSAEAPVVLPALPPNLAAACDRPTKLPAGDMDQSAVTRAWGRDRAALVRCGDRHGALVGYYGELRTRLGGAAR